LGSSELVQSYARYGFEKNPMGLWCRLFKYTQQMLGSASECAHDDEPILLVANPRMHYEEAFSLRTYLAVLWQWERVYLVTVGASDSEIFSNALSNQERERAYLDPKILEEYYFHSDTLSRLTQVERERLGAIVILAPENLLKDFLAGASDWLQPGRYRSTDFNLQAIQVRLLCLNQWPLGPNNGYVS
jgi:hypothetical protein